MSNFYKKNEQTGSVRVVDPDPAVGWDHFELGTTGSGVIENFCRFVGY